MGNNNNVTPQVLANDISQNRNVMLFGPHGAGKTSIVRKAMKILDSPWMYTSAGNMDPYVDFVGIPEVVEDPTVPGGRDLRAVRKHHIDKVKAVFMDEFNRAEKVCINGTFELVDQHAINGEPLPNLQSVIVAINPPGNGYTVDDLDPAMVDRFDRFYEVTAQVSVSLFRELGFSHPVATALVRWYQENQRGKAPYISPRRLEKMGRNYLDNKTLNSLKSSVPPGISLDLGKLHQLLQEAEGDAAPAKKKASAKRPVSGNDVAAKLKGSDPGKLRLKPNREKLEAALDDPTLTTQSKQILLDLAAQALSYNVGAGNLVTGWSTVVNRMSPTQLAIMASTWDYQKCQSIRRELPASRIASAQRANLLVALPW